MDTHKNDLNEAILIRTQHILLQNNSTKTKVLNKLTISLDKRGWYQIFFFLFSSMKTYVVGTH